MKLFVNSKETELAESSDIIALSQQLQLPEKGVAIAVNNKMVPRIEWGQTVLKEGDNVTIIKAACGG